MDFKFDEEIDRMGTNCVKWEFIATEDAIIYGDHAHPRHGDQRLLPMWIADMDFRAPPAVIESLTERAKQGVFGYSAPCDSYYETVIAWFTRRYNRVIEREWIVVTPGVVPALNMIVPSFVKPGEKILVQPPVYHPFFSVIENHGAEMVANSLILEDGRYRMDFEDLARKAADPQVKMAILCHPHNPVGRVWSKEELARFGEICLENDVLVISDEIHCDLIYDGHSFVSFASISEEFERKSIICTAPSKSFNLAGLKTSNIIIPDKALRLKLMETMMRSGMFGTNAFGIVAAEAAYNHGEAWLSAVMDYIQSNYRAMVDFFSEHLPQIRVIQPEGTYLAWVDFGALGLDPEARHDLFFNKARVYLNSGAVFGAEGADFERFNLACTRSTLMTALERIKSVIEQIATV